MKNIVFFCGALVLMAVALVAILVPSVDPTSSGDLISGDGGDVGSRSNEARASIRVAGDLFDNVSRGKLEKFLSLVAASDSDSKSLTLSLSGIPLSVKKIDYLIDEMGREGTMRYLEDFEGGVHEAEFSSVIYNRFIEREIESDYAEAIRVIARVGVSALQSENFSSLVAHAILADDHESIELISDVLIAKKLWSQRVDATLLEKILAKRSSFEHAINDLQKIDSSGILAVTLVVDYLGDEAVMVDLDSDDGIFILEYLEGKDFLNKDEYIEGFVSRNSKIVDDGTR